WPAAALEERAWVADPVLALAQRLEDQDVEVAAWSVAVGPPADTIVRRAEQIDADLILLGAGDRPPGGGLPTRPGATAGPGPAAPPVLAVRPGEPPAGFRTILCPVDHSPAARRGLGNALRLARAFHGQLVVLSVVPETSWLPEALATGEFAGAVAEHGRAWR